MTRATKCKKCGAKLLVLWVGGTIPWTPCPVCDRDEIKASTTPQTQAQGIQARCPKANAEVGGYQFCSELNCPKGFHYANGSACKLIQIAPYIEGKKKGGRR